MWSFFRQLFGHAQLQIDTHLTEQQAISIARAAAIDEPLREQLAMTLVEPRPAGPVWIVGSAAMGASLEVIIDDASGKVLEIKRAGLR
jgi:hypothetical protein